MDIEKKAATPLKDVKTFAKKHRIDIDDAKSILEQHGDDPKSADKAARRIAV